MIKIILVIILALLSLKLDSFSKVFKPLLIIYLLISAFLFYRFFMEAFVIYYSGAEVQFEGQEATEVNLAKHWYFIFSGVALLSFIPVLWFIPALQKVPYLATVFLVISILPNLAQERIWKSIIITEEKTTLTNGST